MNRIFFGLVLTVGACSRSTTPADDGNAIPPVGSVGDDASRTSEWAAIEQIEVQAKAIAKVEGCSSSGDCRAAPVGSRACGGPRYYITYCAKTTDSAGLYSKLSQIAKAEQAYNKKYQIASTCEFRMPPAVEAAGGSCRAP